MPEWLYDLSHFFGCACLTNGVPHFVNSVLGGSFQSPFSPALGEALSPPIVAVLRGFANLIIGYLLICRVGSSGLRSTTQIIASGLGICLVGLPLARRFSRFNTDNARGIS